MRTRTRKPTTQQPSRRRPRGELYSKTVRGKRWDVYEAIAEKEDYGVSFRRGDIGINVYFARLPGGPDGIMISDTKRGIILSLLLPKENQK